MDEPEGLISGRGVSFLPMITDERGKNVHKKQEALIKELIESLKHYLELEDRRLEAREEVMYSCFLYCAMQMTREKENRRDPSYRLQERSQSFGGIIEIAGDVGTDKSDIKSYCDFLKVVYGRYRDRCRIRFEKCDSRDFTDKRSKFCSQVMEDLEQALNKYEYIIDPPRETRIELCNEGMRESS